MRRKVESASVKVGFVEEVLDMANRYAEELTKVNETNMMLESQNRLLDLEMCESMRVLDAESDVRPLPQPQLLGTFGNPGPSAYKN